MNQPLVFDENSPKIQEKIAILDNMIRESGECPTWDCSELEKSKRRAELDLEEFRLKKEWGIETYKKIKERIMEQIDNELAEIIDQIDQGARPREDQNLYMWNVIQKLYWQVYAFSKSGAPYTPYEYETPEGDTVSEGYFETANKTSWAREGKISFLMWKLIEKRLWHQEQ